MYPHPLLVLAVVGLAAAQRLGELLWARRALRRRRAALPPSQAAPAIQPEPMYPAMVLLHVAWLAGCLLEPLSVPHEVPPAWAATMAGVWLGALAGRLWVLRTLGMHWHVRIVQHADQAVVTDGPYRWLRHPNYAVVILELAAVPMLLGAYTTAVVASLVNIAVLTARIRREEAYLMALPAYRAAFMRKARFIPGVF